MQLYKHQQDFLKANPHKSALVWSCGTGKTRTAIEWARIPGSSTLIICPKALKANWWREIEKFCNGLGAYLVLTKEEFRSKCKELPVFNHVIVDEVHNGFLTPHFKSQMSKALRGYLKKHNVPRVLLLSATVYTSSPWNIYNLAYYLGYHWDWQKFNFAFFNQVRFGPRIVPVPKKGCEARLAELTKKIASVVDIHDCMDVPEQLHEEPEYFALTKEQTKAIKDAYDPLPIVRYTKQHEIENGFVYDPYGNPQTFESDKIERIKALCEENKKIAIICRYNAQIDQLRDGFQSNELFVIRGDVRDRDTITRQAEAAPKAIVLIQADCAEGYELPSFGLCVFASMSYSYVKWEQICGRFLRMNKPSRTVFKYLLTEGDSIDQAVYDSIKRKETFSMEIYAREKLSKPI